VNPPFCRNPTAYHRATQTNQLNPVRLHSLLPEDHPQYFFPPPPTCTKQPGPSRHYVHHFVVLSSLPYVSCISVRTSCSIEWFSQHYATSAKHGSLHYVIFSIPLFVPLLDTHILVNTRSLNIPIL
jgi:hypothetical protein